MTSNKQIILEGRGPAILRPADHIATGGEGAIYKVGDLAVKMYLDPDKMRRAGLPDKIRLLAKLTHPYIVCPRGLVTNAAGEPVGHYLPFVEGPPKGHPLSIVFTNDFWTQERFEVRHASMLVERMRETVDFAHQNGAIMVDANELNWFALLNGAGPEPRVIDVDSWAVGKWPASVIMPSIRDWHHSSFDEMSDWFAWAIVTFSIYTGLHPYKGSLDGFDRGDLVGRMKSNASVFSPKVRLNAAVRDFASIPSVLRGWYEAAFQDGERTKPPSPFDKSISAAPAARTMRTVVGGAGVLEFEKIFSKPGDEVVRTFFCGAVLTASGALFDLKTKREIGKGRKDCEIVRLDGGWMVGDSDGFRFIRENDLSVELLALQIRARTLLGYQNRMFAVTESGLVEVNLKIFGTRPIASVGQTWGIMVNSTRWFQGVGAFDAMGAMFVVAPFGREAVAQVRIKELDGMKVVAGKAGDHFVALVAIDRLGSYHKVELTFDREYAAPPKVWLGPTDAAELNLAILPKGVCATIVKDEELDIFVPTTGAVRRVADAQIATDMVLSNWMDLVTFVQGGEVWSLRVR